MGVGQSGTFVANFCQSVLSGGEREEGMRACTGEKGSGVHSGMKSGNNEYTNGSSTQRYVCLSLIPKPHGLGMRLVQPGTRLLY